MNKIKKKPIKPNKTSEIIPPVVTTARNTLSVNLGSVVITLGAGAIFFSGSKAVMGSSC
jgi:hypothetical protein